MRSIFCGNFEHDARQSDLERLFRRYGKVDRVDMKPGFAFVYMEDERDAEDAIQGLDRIEFGRKGRRLRVEWTKQDRSSIRRPGSSRRSSNLRPSKTLFVINFDPYHTRTRDLERHFDPYGKILNIRIRRNFAFVQYESQEDATRALDATNMSKLMDRVVSVEYAIKDDDERRNGYSPERIRDRSPGRRSYDRGGRSPSPSRRERGSPDYGRGRGQFPSPYRRERGSPVYGHGRSPSPILNGREKHSDYSRGRSLSPQREKRSVDNGRGPSARGRMNSDYGRRSSQSPSPSPRGERKRISPDDERCGSSPLSKPDLRGSPGYGEVESPEHQRDRSQSPLERERSQSCSRSRSRSRS